MVGELSRRAGGLLDSELSGPGRLVRRGQVSRSSVELC